MSSGLRLAGLRLPALWLGLLALAAQSQWSLAALCQFLANHLSIYLVHLCPFGLMALLISVVSLFLLSRLFQATRFLLVTCLWALDHRLLDLLAL